MPLSVRLNSVWTKHADKNERKVIDDAGEEMQFFLGCFMPAVCFPFLSLSFPSLIHV